MWYKKQSQSKFSGGAYLLHPPPPPPPDPPLHDIHFKKKLFQKFHHFLYIILYKCMLKLQGYMSVNNIKLMQ